MSVKSLTLVCALSFSMNAVANEHGMPMAGHTETAMAHPGSPPPVSSGHSRWHRGPAHLDGSLWRAGHWWHGVRGNRHGWWWNVGPNWYWYPVAVYLYPDLYTPPYQASGYWYWCDFYQNYYPNVATCPSEWQAVESE
jgi:hypothetical protein